MRLAGCTDFQPVASNASARVTPCGLIARSRSSRLLLGGAACMGGSDASGSGSTTGAGKVTTLSVTGVSVGAEAWKTGTPLRKVLVTARPRFATSLGTLIDGQRNALISSARVAPSGRLRRLVMICEREGALPMTIGGNAGADVSIVCLQGFEGGEGPRRSC